MGVQVVDSRSPVALLVIRPAMRITRDATIAAAAARMAEANVSSLLVGPESEAIVTERDLTRAIAAGWSVEMPVAAIATPNPLSVPGALPIVDAAALMLNEDVRHLVIEVTDGDDGVVSMREVTAVLLSSADERVWLRTLRLCVSAP